METRVLVSRHFFSSAVSVLLIAFISAPSLAKERQRISFYKINKDGITQSVRFVAAKARKPGCHNFIRKTRLHRVVSYRYERCHVYTKKNCDAESILSFHTEKEPEKATTELIEGFGWYPVGDHKRGERAKSWHCE